MHRLDRPKYSKLTIKSQKNCQLKKTAKQIKGNDLLAYGSLTATIHSWRVPDMYDGKLDTFWSQGYETGPHGVSYVFNTAQVVSKVSIIRRRKIIFLVAFKDLDLM